MDFIRIWRLLFRAMNLFDEENKSTILKRVHGAILLILTSAMYLGVLLQDIALFTAATPARSHTAYMALATSKILIKRVVFLVENRAITKMWHQLDGQAFKTKNSDEMM